MPNDYRAYIIIGNKENYKAKVYTLSSDAPPLEPNVFNGNSIENTINIAVDKLKELNKGMNYEDNI